MRIKLFGICLLLLIAVLMQGCGFKFRNSALVTPTVRVIYVKTSLPYTGLVAELCRNFSALGVRITQQPCQTSLTLHILCERFQESRVTISATSLLSQYLLTYEVVYQLEDSRGCLLVAPRTVRVLRNYTVNANQILGASNELPLLQQDMRRDIVYQLINQLNSHCVLEAIRCAHLEDARCCTCS